MFVCVCIYVCVCNCICKNMCKYYYIYYIYIYIYIYYTYVNKNVCMDGGWMDVYTELLSQSVDICSLLNREAKANERKCV